jgi:hypothetical protein
MHVVTIDIEVLLERFPVLRHESGIIVLIAHGGDACEHIAQVLMWVDSKALASDEDGVVKWPPSIG